MRKLQREAADAKWELKSYVSQRIHEDWNSPRAAIEALIKTEVRYQELAADEERKRKDLAKLKRQIRTTIKNELKSLEAEIM